jgi:hypothetical protein
LAICGLLLGGSGDRECAVRQAIFGKSRRLAGVRIRRPRRTDVQKVLSDAATLEGDRWWDWPARVLLGESAGGSRALEEGEQADCENVLIRQGLIDMLMHNWRRFAAEAVPLWRVLL